MQQYNSKFDKRVEVWHSGNRWCGSRSEPLLMRLVPKGTPTGAQQQGFLVSGTDRTPSDIKHLHGWRGGKHRLGYTRLQAERRVCERPHKVSEHGGTRPMPMTRGLQGALASCTTGKAGDGGLTTLGRVIA